MKQKSNSSHCSSKMNIIKPKISNNKPRKAHKKFQTRTKNKINKLISHLQSSFDSTTFISETTVIDLENSQPIKRKTSSALSSPIAKKIRPNTSITSIVINDDDDLITNTMPVLKEGPLAHCSTPIQEKCGTNLYKAIKKTAIKDMTNVTDDKNNEAEIKSVTLSKDNSTENQSTSPATSNKNTTKVINKDSFLTIDLTNSKDQSTLKKETVIDLVADDTGSASTVDSDCMFVSYNDSIHLKTGGRRSKKRKENVDLNKFVKGIHDLNSSDKNRLINIIAESIFNGCKKPESIRNLQRIKCPTDVSIQASDEMCIVNNVQLDNSVSRNSVGSNIYNPEHKAKKHTGLRMIVIDGSNVAMSHGQHRIFSVKGLKICIDYFKKRGHEVKAFVPHFRCKFGKSSNPKLLMELERQGVVVFTPSRMINGKTCTPYDDRYIIQCAAEFNGVIVSGDNYRDLLNENAKWRFVIEKRVLPFTWVQDMIMFPKDPLGREGPTLEQLLRHTSSSIQL